MAKYAGVWGIDIGQCAFKAMRCKLEDGVVVADAFDYIEYPKILSQPEAEPEKMVRDALDQFLSRNDIKGYRIGLSVPGQSGLAKFFKPPPVEAKKIPEIVKFEARQQIPFPLEDVVWDYQQMGDLDSDGFTMETEVGLFAMKRDQAYRAMKPFQDVGVELDIIQLAPLCIYNFVSYDILGDALDSEEFDPDNPPPSLVVLSMGTDTTDLVITNGFRVWQRSIPLGGNHFTKQLTKELKLTFAKAEHLKRNARQAEDPKLVFQAMRPVFNDLVTEVQRSIGYFQGIDRKARIGGVVILGNAVKLPGLQQYLAKNMGYEVNNFETFSRLTGKPVLSAPAFHDNRLSFGVSYGLCLQGLGASRLDTNLVPREIVTERLVRAKKPWAVASVAVLLLGCTFHLFFQSARLNEVAEDKKGANVTWKDAMSEVQQVSSRSSSFQNEDSQLVAQLQRITAIGEELVGNTDRRILWLEMLKTINEALPRTDPLNPGKIPDVDEVEFDKRKEIHVQKLEVEYFDSLSDWFTDAVKTHYVEQLKSVKQTPQVNAAPDELAADTGPKPPEGSGWVIELTCYHYFNSDRRTQGVRHVLNTLIQNLRSGRVVFPVPVTKILPGVVVRHQVANRFVPVRVADIQPLRQQNQQTGAEEVTGYQMQLQGVQNPISMPADGLVPVVFTMREMGIDYPVIITKNKINFKAQVPNPNYVPANTPGSDGGRMGGGMMGGMSGGMSGVPGVEGSMGGGPPGFGSTSSAATSQGGNESQEPPTLIVPRYDFIVQFSWTEKLLAQRLEEQVKQWETEKQQQANQPTAETNLAANQKGGA